MSKCQPPALPLLAAASRVLVVLSLVLINPWGTPRGEIWTDPKVYALIALTLLIWAALLVHQVRHAVQQVARRASPVAPVVSVGRPPPSWGWVALLWLLFLGAGLLTAYFSPVRFDNALRAHNEMGDGWLYWAWLGAFTLGNALLLRRFPALFRPQLFGVLVAGALMGAAVLLQSADWRLDLTATMGQVLSTSGPNRPNVLRSLIYEGQMPIGLTSHRGHAAFVLAAVGVLALVSILRGWVRSRYAWPLYLLALVGLYLTATRGAQLAFAVGALYLLGRFWRVAGARRTLVLALLPLLAGGALFGVLGGTRALPPLGTLLSNPSGFTSARSYLWPSALDSVRERPLLGWGFNGYGLAWPHVVDFSERYKVNLAWQGGNVVEMVSLQGTDHYTFRYVGEDGLLHRGRVLTNKSHNFILDTAVSLGGVGLTLYLLLLGVLLVVTTRGAGWGLEVVGVVYIVYGLTWFESAQFSHLTYWALSVGLAGQPYRSATQRRPFDRLFATEEGAKAGT